MLVQESDLGRGSGFCSPAASTPTKSPPMCIHCASGKAYSLGRAEYGRLGLGTGAEEKSTPTVIPELPSITSVACGASVGYAVSSDGECWGLGALPSVPSSSCTPSPHTASWAGTGATFWCRSPGGSRAVAAQMCLWACGSRVGPVVFTQKGLLA